MATQRLPIPGSDNGTWGSILNGFLEVSHNADGTLIPSAVTAAGAAPLASPSFTGTPTAPTATVGTNTTQLATTAFTTTAVGALNGQYVPPGDISTEGLLQATTNSRLVMREVGRACINITDPKYGAVADSGTTDNTAAILAAITDAVSLGLPVYAPGNGSSSYGFSGNISNPTLGGTITFQGCALIGDGGIKNEWRTKFLCTAPASRIAMGYTAHGVLSPNPGSAGYAGDRAAATGGFVVDGNHIATQPFLWGARTQSIGYEISVTNSATQPAYSGGTAYTTGQRVFYEGFTFQCLTNTTGNAPSVTQVTTGSATFGAYPAVTTYWAPVADSAGMVFAEGQNNVFIQFDSEDHAGAGVIWDGSFGGNKFVVLEVTSSGASGTWQHIIGQNYVSGSSYLEPIQNTIDQGINERLPAGALGNLLQWAGVSNIFNQPIFSAVSGPYSASYNAVSAVSGSGLSSYYLTLNQPSFALDATYGTGMACGSGAMIEHHGANVTGGAFLYLVESGSYIEEWTVKYSCARFNSQGVTTDSTLVRASFSGPWNLFSEPILGGSTVLQLTDAGLFQWYLSGSPSASLQMLSAGGAILVNGGLYATGEIGYVTGAGGTVTQTTSRTTGVTLGKESGQITTSSASLAGGASASFTVTNGVVHATDTVILNIVSGQTQPTTQAWVSAVATDSFQITVYNPSASAETGAIVIVFALIKAVNS